VTQTLRVSAHANLQISSRNSLGKLGKQVNIVQEAAFSAGSRVVASLAATMEDLESVVMVGQFGLA